MQYGQNHKFGFEYLANYANDAAYREKTRGRLNWVIFVDVANKCARTQTHTDWYEYWQEDKGREEWLAV